MVEMPWDGEFSDHALTWGEMAGSDMDKWGEWSDHRRTVTIECANCGQEEERDTRNAQFELAKRTDAPFYCSKECADTAEEIGRTSMEFDTKPCAREECDDEVTLYSSSAFAQRIWGVGKDCKYCSTKCWGLDQRVERDRNYGYNWDEQREKAIQRDDERCAKCGMARGTHYNQFDHDIHVHHITPLRTFDDDDWESANRLENLVTLCTKCHRKVEAGTETLE